MKNMRVSQMKTLKVQKKIEILLFAAIGTASHHHGLEACTMYGTSDNTGLMTSTEHAKMAAVLEAGMKEEQHSVIRFFFG
jgi:hypothetical protein